MNCLYVNSTVEVVLQALKTSCDLPVSACPRALCMGIRGCLCFPSFCPPQQPFAWKRDVLVCSKAVSTAPFSKPALFLLNVLNKNAWALFFIIFSHYTSAKPHSSHDQQPHQFTLFSCPPLSVQPLDPLWKSWYLPRKTCSPFSAPLTSCSFELQSSNVLPASSSLQIFLTLWQITIA